MKRLSSVLLLLFCVSLPVRAQDAQSPQALAAARELASILTGDTLSQITAAMTAQIWPNIEHAFSTKVDAATIADMRAEFERTVNSFTGEVMKDAPAIYARHFTAQELNDMIAFYKSPTGQKALHELPKVLADVGTEMAPRMQAFQGQLNTRMRAILQQHGYKQ